MKSKEEIEIFKAKWNKEAPISKGYERQFVICKECGNLAYYDFVPYSLSTPIMVAYCGHNFRTSYTQI